MTTSGSHMLVASINDAHHCVDWLFDGALVADQSYEEVAT